LTRHDAASIGFKDSHIYEELSLPPDDRSIGFMQVQHPKAAELFREWTDKADKVVY
jgi:hypothetical protein